MVALALFTLLVAGEVFCPLVGILPFPAGVVVGVIGFAGVFGCGVVGLPVLPLGVPFSLGVVGPTGFSFGV